MYSGQRTAIRYRIEWLKQTIELNDNNSRTTLGREMLSWKSAFTRDSFLTSIEFGNSVMSVKCKSIHSIPYNCSLQQTEPEVFKLNLAPSASCHSSERGSKSPLRLLLLLLLAIYYRKRCSLCGSSRNSLSENRAEFGPAQRYQSFGCAASSARRLREFRTFPGRAAASASRDFWEMVQKGLKR